MDTEIHDIAAQFGIDAMSFKEQSNVVLSRVIMINAEFVLRGRKLHKETLPHLDQEQALVEAVRPLVQIAFPQLLTTKDGNTYVAGDELLWTAYPLLEGEILCNWWEVEKLPEGSRQEAFQTLSYIHNATKGKIQNLAKGVQYSFIEDISKQFENLKPNLSTEEVTRVEKSLSRVRIAAAEVKEEDMVFVHGDFHSGNCLVKDGKVVGILDTDWSRRGYFLEDVAYAVINYTRLCKERDFVFNNQQFEAILRWYGLPPSLVPLLKEYMILYALFDLHGLLVGTWPLENKEQITRLQRSMLTDFCKRF